MCHYVLGMKGAANPGVTVPREAVYSIVKGHGRVVRGVTRGCVGWDGGFGTPYTGPGAGSTRRGICRALWRVELA